MIITDEEAAELKTWVVRKLEDISDADSDVLADYVLALIRADTPETELRLNAIENLEDFLKDNTQAFVDAIFVTIHNKSYMPGHVPPKGASAGSLPFTATSPIAGVFPQDASKSGAYGGSQPPRKRPYSDKSEDGGVGDPHYGRGDRQMKQMRRGGSRSGRGDSFGVRPGRGGHQLSGSSPGVVAGSTMPFPNLAIPPPGLPFDPNDPIAAMMTIQAMGLPPFPSIPPLPGSLPNLDQFIPQALSSPRNTKTNARCRDYDNKGYCTRGNSCPYEHGSDHMVVSGQDEYDPKNSVMMDIPKIPTSTNGHSNVQRSQGAGRLRTRREFEERGNHIQPRRNRAEFSHNGPNHDRSITTIVVEQIPEDHFDEQSVKTFFADFGNIVEVTMQAYKRLALVKYDDYVSARKAYESPKVIFDNRFVKVYWYKPQNASNASSTVANGKTVTTSQHSSAPGEQAYDKEKFERDAMAAQKKLEEKKQMLRDTEAKRQELEKQREDLARRQADEKKKLLEKLASKGRLKDAEGDSPDETTRQSKDPTNGADDTNVSAQTKALRAQVAALEAEAKSLGLDTALTESPWPHRGHGRGRGRGSYRGWEGFAGRGAGDNPSRGGGRGRGAFRGGRGGGAYNLDNRTRKVGVTGIGLDDEQKDEALRQYLLGVGEFEAIEPSGDRADMQVVIFKDRFTAEQFMYGSKEIPGVGKVELSWVNVSSTPASSTTKQPGLDSDTGTADANPDGEHGDKGGAAEVDYDVAEEDDRWMVE